MHSLPLRVEMLLQAHRLPLLPEILELESQLHVCVSWLVLPRSLLQAHRL
jgi:hypothetical protein